MVNLGTASGKIVVDGSGAAAGFGVATSAAQAFFDVVADRVNEIQAVGDKLTKIGAVAAGGFGIAINAAASFEQRLSAIEAVSGATEAQMEAVSKKALQLGADTKFSASEAAQAIEELVKAGISVDDALNGAADATVALAAAGEIELPRAAEIAANAMNVFNLSAEDMPRVADLVAGAANASAISVEEFAQSLQQSGAAANLAGLTFDDLSTAIAIMGNAGIKGSDAGTSLKTMLLNLNPVTKKQKDLMKELGIVTKDGANQFFDAQGKAKSFGEIAGVLQNALKGMTDQQKLATLETLFGSDAIRAAAVVADAGTQGFNDMAVAMGKVTAASVAATRMDNLRGSLEELKGSLETAAIVIGSYFLPALQRIVDFITKLVNVFNNAPEGVQKFITVFLAGGAAMALFLGIAIKLLFILGPLLAKFLGLLALKQIFSIFTTGFAALRGGAGILAALGAAGARALTVFGRFGTILKIAFGAIRTLVGGLGFLRIAIGAAFGPWGAIIGAAITAVMLLYKHFAPFRELVQSIGNAIRSGFLSALQAAQTAITMFVDAFKTGMTEDEGTWFERVALGARTLWLALQQLANAFMTQLWPALQQAGGAVWQMLLTAFQQISAVVQSQFVPAIQQLWTAIQPLIPNLMAVGAAIGQFLMIMLQITGVILRVAAVIIGTLLLAFIQIATIMVGTVIPAIISFVTTILGFLIPIFTTLVTWIIQAISAFIRFGAAIVTGLQTAYAAVAAVVAGIIGFFAGLIAAFIGFVTSVQQKWIAFWAQFAPIAQAAWALITAIVQLGINLIKLAIAVGLAVIRVVWQTAWNALRTVASAVWNAIVAVVTAAVNRVKAVVTAVINAVKAVITGAWRAISGDTNATWSSISSSVSSKVNAVKAAITSALNAAKAVITSAWNTAKSLTTSAWNAIVSAVTSAVGRLMAVVSSIKGKVTSALSGAGSWLVSAGRALVQGFINGVSGMLGAAAAKVSELASLAKKAAAAALSIGSPSKVFAELGVFTVQGYIEGLKDQAKPLEGTLTHLLEPPVITPGRAIGIEPASHTAARDTAIIDSTLSALSGKFDQMIALMREQGLEVPGINVDVEVHADEPQSIRVNRTLQRSANGTLV